MRDSVKGLVSAVVLFFMLLAYISGALLLILGAAYIQVSFDNEDVADYTQTHAFRLQVKDTFDALYEAVNSKTPAAPPEGGRVMYFAYSLTTGRMLTSDENVADIPSFEALYGENEDFVFVCRYAADLFRVRSSAGGAAGEREYAYSASAPLFAGETRNYPNSMIIIALAEPKPALSGFGFSRVEYFVLTEGILWVFLTFGLFFISVSVVIIAGKSRKKVNRAVARAVSWVYFEVKLALLAFALWFCLSVFSFPLSYEFLIRLAAAGGPALYLVGCSAVYGGKSFFAKSLFADLYRAGRRFLDEALPVMPIQKKLRHRVVLLFLYGLAVPVALFLLSDKLLSPETVRLLVPFFILYYAALLALFARSYVALVNGVAELERFSALIPKGGRLPDAGLSEGSDLYALASNIASVEDSVSAASEKMFVQANKRLADIASSIDELKDQITVLSNMTDDEGVTGAARRMNALADRMVVTLSKGSPINAPVLKRVDFLSLLDGAINARIVELSAARLTIKASLPPPPAFITADAMHMKAALDIVINNLARHALSNTAVGITLEKKDEFWRFSVVNYVPPESHVEKKPELSSSGLYLAEEYLTLNGCKMEVMTDGDKFGTMFVMPAAH